MCNVHWNLPKFQWTLRNYGKKKGTIAGITVLSISCVLVSTHCLPRWNNALFWNQCFSVLVLESTCPFYSIAPRLLTKLLLVVFLFFFTDFLLLTNLSPIFSSHNFPAQKDFAPNFPHTNFSPQIFCPKLSTFFVGICAGDVACRGCGRWWTSLRWRRTSRCTRLGTKSGRLRPIKINQNRFYACSSEEVFFSGSGYSTDQSDFFNGQYLAVWLRTSLLMWKPGECGWAGGCIWDTRGTTGAAAQWGERTLQWLPRPLFTA